MAIVPQASGATPSARCKRELVVVYSSNAGWPGLMCAAAPNAASVAS